MFKKLPLILGLLSVTVLILSFNNSSQAAPTPTLPAERVETLVQAVGVADERPLLREHLISRLPNYQTEIRPVLEKAGVQFLAEKILSHEVRDPKTNVEVKEFIADMKDLNWPLSQFYMVSAELLRKLKTANENKQNFNLSEGLLAAGTDAGVKPEIMERFTGQPEIMALFTGYQADSIKSQIKAAGPENLDKITAILSSLPEGSEHSFIDEYEYLLAALTFSAKPAERQAALKHPNIFSALERLAGSAEIQSMLAQFYALVAVDALEAGDKTQAANWLERSETQRSNLKSQLLVKKFLAAEAFKAPESALVSDSSMPATPVAVSSEPFAEPSAPATGAKLAKRELDFGSERAQRESVSAKTSKVAGGSPIGLGGALTLLLIGGAVWYLRFVKRRTEVILGSLGDSIDLKDEVSHWDFPAENAGPMERERRTVNE